MNIYIDIDKNQEMPETDLMLQAHNLEWRLREKYPHAAIEINVEDGLWNREYIIFDDAEMVGEECGNNEYRYYDGEYNREITERESQANDTLRNFCREVTERGEWHYPDYAASYMKEHAHS